MSPLAWIFRADPPRFEPVGDDRRELHELLMEHMTVGGYVHDVEHYETAVIYAVPEEEPTLQDVIHLMAFALYFLAFLRNLVIRYGIQEPRS